MTPRTRKRAHPAAGGDGTTPIASPPEAVWRVVCASVAGTSHARTGGECQDAAGWRALPGGMLAVAVADGAGSAECARQGAQLAVFAALDYLTAALADGGMTPPASSPSPAAALQAAGEGAGGEDLPDHLLSALSHARAALLGLAAADGRPARDYSATLTLAAAGPHGLAAAAIGDCAMVAQSADGPLHTVTRLERGEYANETHFLTAPDWHAHVQTTVLDVPAARLAVFSDGLARLALRWPEHAPHAPFFTPLFEFAAAAADPGEAGERLAEFLASPRVNARTDDDKTLILAAYGPLH